MAEESLDFADPLDPNDIEAAKQLQKEAFEDATVKKRDALRARRDAYRQLFGNNGIFGDAVLADLRRFCRGNQTPWDADPRVHALLTGRFEVFTRIIQHTTLSLDELWELLEGPANANE